MAQAVFLERPLHGFTVPTCSVLDHSVYPHLMDDIIDSAPPASCLVLRATSREFRTRIDGLLFKHVVIGPRGDGASKGFPAVAAAAGAFKLRVAGRGGGDSSSSDNSDSDGPASPTSSTGSHSSGRSDSSLIAWLTPLLAHTTIVSLRGPVDSYAGGLAWFSPNLKHVETLRILPPMPRPLSIWPDTVRGARTLIAFTVMTRGVQRTLLGDDGPDAAIVYHPPMALVPPVPISVRRLVVNVRLHLDDPWGADSRIGGLSLPNGVKTLVLIFATEPPPDVVPQMGGRVGPAPLPMPRGAAYATSERRRPRFGNQALGMLNPVLRAMAQSPEMRVTIVNAASLGTAPFCLDDDAEFEVDTIIKETAEEVLCGDYGLQKAHIKTMTLEEYRSTVCAEQFELETEE